MANWADIKNPAIYSNILVFHFSQYKTIQVKSPKTFDLGNIPEQTLTGVNKQQMTPPPNIWTKRQTDQAVAPRGPLALQNPAVFNKYSSPNRFGESWSRRVHVPSVSVYFWSEKWIGPDPAKTDSPILSSWPDTCVHFHNTVTMQDTVAVQMSKVKKIYIYI